LRPIFNESLDRANTMCNAVRGGSAVERERGRSGGPDRSPDCLDLASLVDHHPCGGRDV